jgi:hypothetical protein
MKFKRFLDEEYVGSVDGDKGWKFSGGYTEIFKNPTPKEMVDAANASKSFKGLVRFIIDYKKKNIFVFKGDTFHVDVFDFLKKEGEISNSDWCSRLSMDMIWASGYVDSGKIRYDSSDSYNYFKQWFSEIPDKNDSWTKRWFGIPFFENYKKYGHD